MHRVPRLFGGGTAQRPGTRFGIGRVTPTRLTHPGAIGQGDTFGATSVTRSQLKYVALSLSSNMKGYSGSAWAQLPGGTVRNLALELLDKGIAKVALGLLRLNKAGAEGTWTRADQTYVTTQLEAALSDYRAAAGFIATSGIPMPAPRGIDVVIPTGWTAPPTPGDAPPVAPPTTPIPSGGLIFPPTSPDIAPWEVPLGPPAPSAPPVVAAAIGGGAVVAGLGLLYLLLR